VGVHPDGMAGGERPESGPDGLRLYGRAVGLQARTHTVAGTRAAAVCPGRSGVHRRAASVGGQEIATPVRLPFPLERGRTAFRAGQGSSGRPGRPVRHPVSQTGVLRRAGRAFRRGPGFRTRAASPRMVDRAARSGGQGQPGRTATGEQRVLPGAENLRAASGLPESLGRRAAAVCPQRGHRVHLTDQDAGIPGGGRAGGVHGHS